MDKKRTIINTFLSIYTYTYTYLPDVCVYTGSVAHCIKDSFGDFSSSSELCAARFMERVDVCVCVSLCANLSQFYVMYCAIVALYLCAIAFAVAPLIYAPTLH